MRFPLPIFRAREMEGRNGRNTLFVAAVDPRAPHPVAVAAQEIVESRWKLARFALAVIFSAAIAALIWFLALPMVSGLAVPAPILGGALWLRSGPAKRAMELWGHEVEVQAAVSYYGADEARKRRSEARSMVAHDGYRFGDWTVSEVVEGMKGRRKAARRWVGDHEADLAHAERVLERRL